MDKYHMLKSNDALYDMDMGLLDLRQLQKDMQDIVQTGEPVIFLCYDVASFQPIVKNYGRDTANNLLRLVANWMMHFPRCILYSAGEGLFCLVLRYYSLEEAKIVAQQIFERFNAPWDIAHEKGTIELRADIAISVVDPKGKGFPPNLQEFIRQTISEDVKSSDGAAQYNVEIDRLSREHLRMQLHLKNCILQNMRGFRVYYQPVVDPISGLWRGVEALARWNSPAFGAMAPVAFIPELENLKLTRTLGEWIIRTAMQDCKALELDTIEGFILFINVSSQQIRGFGFLDFLGEILEELRFPVSKLVLEITDDETFFQNDANRGLMKRLGLLGVNFALNLDNIVRRSFPDFGSMPVRYIKAKRVGLENIENDHYKQYVYYVLSESVHTHDCFLVAEGVEKTEQLHCLMKNGTDFVQGYLFAQPMGADELSARMGNFYAPPKSFRDAKLDITNFKQWIHGQEAYLISPALFGLLSRCMEIMLEETDMHAGFGRVLEVVGRHFLVQRAFVFTQIEGTIFSNTHEWCAEGAPSHRALFQNMDISDGDFLQMLRDQGVVMATDFSALPSGLQRVVEAEGLETSISSLVALPLLRFGDVVGFVGFDDRRVREWNPEEMILLNSLSMLLLAAMDRQWEHMPRHTDSLQLS